MSGKVTRQLEERFWEKVGPRDNAPAACWEWTAYRDPHGYGRFGLRRRDALAHRVAWMLEHGHIPVGAVVMHVCDNPPCIRVSHLRLGTQADNVRDMYEKGRYLNHGSAQTTCIYGHSLEDAYIAPKTGYRQCRICRLARKRGYDRSAEIAARRAKRHAKAALEAQP